MLMAYLAGFNSSKQWSVGIAAIAILGSSIFWNPFSTALLSYQAYDLHNHQQLDKAMLIYKEIIKRDKNNAFAKTNIQQLEIHELEEKLPCFSKSKTMLKQKRSISKF